VDNDYLFTGRRLDSDTGDYYYRARYYNPEFGQFGATDRYAPDEMTYGYAGGNPVMYSDPWGLAVDYNVGPCEIVIFHGHTYETSDHQYAVGEGGWGKIRINNCGGATVMGCNGINEMDNLRNVNNLPDMPNMGAPDYYIGYVGDDSISDEARQQELRTYIDQLDRIIDDSSQSTNPFTILNVIRRREDRRNAQKRLEQFALATFNRMKRRAKQYARTLCRKSGCGCQSVKIFLRSMQNTHKPSTLGGTDIPDGQVAELHCDRICATQ
jgi:RHS repeat-associated protein